MITKISDMQNKNSQGLLKKARPSKVESRVATVWQLRWLVRTRADISLLPSGLVRPRTDSQSVRHCRELLLWLAQYPYSATPLPRLCHKLTVTWMGTKDV